MLYRQQRNRPYLPGQSVVRLMQTLIIFVLLVSVVMGEDFYPQDPVLGSCMIFGAFLAIYAFVVLMMKISDHMWQKVYDESCERGVTSYEEFKKNADDIKRIRDDRNQ